MIFNHIKIFHFFKYDIKKIRDHGKLRSFKRCVFSKKKLSKVKIKNNYLKLKFSTKKFRKKV